MTRNALSSPTCARRHHWRIVVGMKKSIDVKKREKTKISVYRACVNGDVDLVRHLLDRGASANAKGLTGRTPLHRASDDGNVKLVELLLNRGANVNAKDDIGDTPLHRACRCRSYEVAKLLLDGGADRDLTNDKNQTPLQLVNEMAKKITMMNE